MAIEFTCPHCGKSATVEDSYAGQSGPCPHCGQMITLPVWSGTHTGTPQKSKNSFANFLLIVLALGMSGFVLLVCGGVLIGLLLPAVQAGREASRRMSCSNNLKQIGLALHNYHSVYDTLPPAYMTDSAGHPTVSWRVLILPFMEQQALYDQIDLQQPWDSPANAALLSTTVPPYACPSSVGAMTPHTNYMVVTGPETLFPNEQARSFRDVPDGLSQTIAVVEVEGQGVHWAAPEDLDLQQLTMSFEADVSGQMGSRHPGGIQVLLADGSVNFLSDSIDPNLLKSFLTADGGERVALP